MATLFFNVEADYTKVIELNNQIQKLQATMRSFNANTPVTQIRAVESELARCKAQMQGLIMPAAQLGQQFQSQLPSGIQMTTTNMRNLTGALRDTNGAFSGVSQGVSSFIKQFSAAALAVKGLQTSLNLVKGAMNTIVDFEASGSVLQAVTGFSENSDEFTSMRDKALELGRATRYTASQVTELEISLAKLGFVPNDINAMSKSILQFGLATGASLDDAATITGASLRMFGADAEEATRYTSAMSAAINKTALNFQAVSDNLATFGPVAKTVGLNIEQSLAIFGKLKDLGYEGSTAATSVRNILNEMSSGKLSKALGYEVDSFEKFIQALKDLGGQGFADGTGQAMKAVGKRGGAQLIALIQNADAVEQKYKEIAEMSASSDGMDELATKMNTNVRGAIAVVQSAWEDLVLQFSNATGPIAEILGVISTGLNVISDTISGKESGETFLGMDGETLLGITEALGGLIATITTYKAMMAGMDKYNEFLSDMQDAVGAEQATRYEAMAKALSGFNVQQGVELDAQSKKMVQNGILTEQQALLVQELREKAKAELVNIDASIERLNVERQVITTGIQKAEADALQAQAELRLAQATYGTAVAQGDQNAVEKIAIAQKKVDIMQTNLQAGKELLNANAKEISTLASRKDAIAQGIDTVAKEANTKATSKLTIAMDALGLSMFTNPYFLVAATIVGLSVAMYKLISGAKGATDAQNALNGSMQDYHDQLEQNKTDAQKWIDVMNDNTATALQQVEAYEKLIEKYKEFKGYTPDQIKSMSQEERERIMNRSNENSEDELNRRRKEMYEQINKLYIENPFTASDADEDAIARSVGGTKFGDILVDELEKVREGADDVRNHIDTLMDEAKKRASEFTEKRFGAEVGKSLQDFVDVDPSSLAVKDAEKYKEVLSKIMEAKEDSFNIKFNSGKELYGDVVSQAKDLESQLNTINKQISATNDKTQKAELEKQKEDVQKALDFFTIIKEAQEQGTREAAEGASKAIKAFSDAMAKLSVSDDTAIVIGDAYQKTMDVIGECTKEYENNGKVSEETAKKAKKAVTDEVSHIEKKITELEKQLQDPKLSEAKKQQIRVDLNNAKQTLADVKSLLDKIKTAIKNNGHFQVVIDFIRRFTDEKDGNKKEVNKKGKREYTSAKTGKKESFAYDSYTEEIKKVGDKTMKYTTYQMSDGKKRTLIEDISNFMSQRIKKGIKQGQDSTAKTTMDKEEDKKGDVIDDKARKNALSDAKKNAEYQEYLRSQEKKDARAKIDLLRESTQEEINTMEDGSDKKLAQINLDFEKRKDTIDRWYEDLRETNYKNAKDAFYRDPKNEGKVFGENFNSGKFAPNAEQSALYQQKKDANEARFFRDVDSLTKTYQTQSQKQSEQIKSITRDEVTIQKMLSDNLKKKEQGEVYDQDLIDTLTERLALLKQMKAELGQEILAKYDIESAKDKAVKPIDEEIDKLKVLREEANKSGDNDKVGAIDKAIAEATKERYKAQVEVEFEFFKKDPMYAMAFDDLGNATTSTLKEMFDRFDEYIQNGLANGLDPQILQSFFETYNSLLDEMMMRDPFEAVRLSAERLSKAQERLNTAQASYNRVKKQHDNLIRKGKKGTQEEINLAKKEEQAKKNLTQAENDYTKASNKHQKAVKASCDAIDDLADAIASVGNAVEGTEGDILNCISQTMTFATSTINGISQLSKITSMEISNTMKAIESASVILAIVGAAIQLMQAFSSLIKDEHDQYEKLAEKQKEVNTLIDSVNSYKRAVVEAQIAEDSWFSSTGLSNLRNEWKKNQAVATQYYSKLNEQQATYVNESGSGWLTKTMDAIAKASDWIASLPAKAVEGTMDLVGIETDGFIHDTLNAATKVGASIMTMGASEMSRASNKLLQSTTEYAEAVDNVLGDVMGNYDGFDIASMLDENTANITVQTDAIGKLSRAYENLRIETRAASKGFLGTGIGGKSQKTEDLREWVKTNLNADLFDEDGLINLKAAEVVLNKYGDKLVGETKATLEELVELRKEYDEFLESIKEYVSDMFSPLVDNLSDAFFDWLDTGKDVLDSFKQYAVDTFKSIAQEIIKTHLQNAVFKGFEDEMKDITTEWSKGNISEKEYTKRMMLAVDSVIDKAEAEIPRTQQLIEYIDEQLKARDIDLYGDSSQNTTTASVQSLSQDTGEAIEGRLTGVQVAVESILLHETTMMDIPLSRLSQDILDSMNISKDIYNVADEARNYIIMSYLELQEINENTSNMAKTLVTMSANIEEVKKNTKKL